MAISWGSVDEHLRVGIEVTQSPGSVGTGTSSVTLTVKYYVGNPSDSNWTWADNQTLTLTGSLSGTYNFFNDLDGIGDTKLVVTRTLVVSTSYAADVTRTFTAKITGAYNGATPSKTFTHTVDRRPYDTPSAPSNPSVVLANITEDGILTNWTEPSNWGGFDSGDYQLQVADNPAFTGATSYTVNNATSRLITGQPSGSRFYLRVRGNNGGTGNGGGYGDWSGTTSYITRGVPFDPASVSVSDVGSTTATAYAPNGTGYDGATAGNSPTGTDVELSADGGSTWPLSFSAGSPTVPLTGLIPGVEYTPRARHTNSYGESDWVVGDPFVTTGTPTFIKVSGVWKSAVIWVKVAGTWKQVSRMWVKVAGTWK